MFELIFEVIQDLSEARFEGLIKSLIFGWNFLELEFSSYENDKYKFSDKKLIKVTYCLQPRRELCRLGGLAWLYTLSLMPPGEHSVKKLPRPE